MTTVTIGTSSSYTFTGADSIALTLAQGTQARLSVTSASGAQKYSNAISDNRTIGPFATGDVFSVTAIRGSIDYVPVIGDATTLTGNYTLKASDDQQQFKCLAALTISIPDGLNPRPVVTVVPPPSGNLTVAMLGAETVNGALTPLTRGRASNPCGVVISGYKDSAAYGLSGT